MRVVLGSAIIAVVAIGGWAASAHADATVACPLFQATRTIVNPLPPGWSATQDVNGVTNYRVDSSSGQQLLVCKYGASGAVRFTVPANQTCLKVPGRRFQCAVVPPPPPPGPVVISDGPITLVDNGVADLDQGGGQPDLRLNAGNPFLRLIQPINGAQLSQQGTHKPSMDECLSAPYSGSPVLQTQMPVGVWACVTTSSGNVGRIRIANINGIPGIPVPMTIFLDHTTWSATGGPGGGFGGPGGGGGPATHSTKTPTVPQTFTFDLDEGQILGTSTDADFWFEAVNPVQLFIKPMNGAQIAVGNRQNRGYNGCRMEAFSPNQIALNTLAVGDYICAATSEGRVSQFRINAISPGSPKTLTIGYTTWE